MQANLEQLDILEMEILERFNRKNMFKWSYVTNCQFGNIRILITSKTIGDTIKTSRCEWFGIDVILIESIIEIVYIIISSV